MQPNEIKSAVLSNTDELGSLASEKTYRRFTETPNMTTYINESTHSADKRDMVQLKRALPVRAGQFRGAMRSSIKKTVDYDVSAATGDKELVSPLIVELSVSVPMGIKGPFEGGYTISQEVLRQIWDLVGLLQKKVHVDSTSTDLVTMHDDHKLNTLFLVGEI